MSSNYDRKCVVCGESDEVSRFEQCPICRKDFCPDCAYRALGRRFCSAPCSRAFFYGDADDNEGSDSLDDE